MEEAKDITRLLQVDSFCEYFNLDNPIQLWGLEE